MIETLKMLAGNYDALVSPTLITVSSCITAASKIDLNTIYGNTLSLTGLLTYGIVYLITLCLLTQVASRTLLMYGI